MEAGVTGWQHPVAARTAWKLAVVLAVLALAALKSAAQNAPAGKIVVADVVISGNRSTPTDRIMSHLTVRTGAAYYPEALRDTLLEDGRRLSETGLFRDVKPDYKPLADGRFNVLFYVQEYPNTIKEVIYKNANHLSSSELEGLTRLRVGTILNPRANRQACRDIEDALKKQGRYFAHVDLEEGGKDGDRRVVFAISEGPVVRVRHIYFNGNKELATSQRLNTQIVTTKAFLNAFGGKYTPASTDADIAELSKYYKNNGYHDVAISREEIFSNDFRSVDLVYHISEGQKYHVESVTVEGLKEKSQAEVSSFLKIKSGEYYNEGVVAADLRNISDFYGWRGYEVKADKKLYYPEPGLVRVVYDVEEKPAAKVGQIIIIGNSVTQDRVIRRVLGIFPGQTLLYPQMRIAENDLARLGIFNTDPEKGVRPTLTVLDTDSEFKDILVNVQETPTGSLMFGAGVNSNAGLVGSIVLNEKNFDIFRFPTSWADIWEGRAFRGAGQELRIEAVPGTQLQRYSATFREPFLFDQPYSLTTSAYYYQRLYNEDTETREGGSITLGHQFTRNWGANLGIRIENVNIANLDGGNVPSYAPPDYTSVLGNNFQAVPRIGVTYDTRDSFLRPTEGGLLSLSFEEGFGSFTFPVVNIQGSRYYTLFQRPDGSGRQVFAMYSHVGWAGSETPVYERFFAGGFQSMRGFQFRGVGPRVNGYAVGGDFLLLNGLEYQIPLRASDNVYMVAFVDSGTVESRIGINDYRVSAGLGLRLTIPMMGPVPIALDVGFPINQSSQDRTQVFSFWVGLFR